MDLSTLPTFHVSAAEDCRTPPKFIPVNRCPSVVKSFLLEKMLTPRRR
jgi:hypothetical protein